MSLNHSLIVVVVIAVLFCSCDRAKPEYEKATASDTVAAYVRFLALYPDHELADSAKIRMGDAAFRDLTGKTEPQVYMDYLVHYPDSTHVSEIRAHLEPILYAKCMEVRDAAVCDDYLRVFEGEAREADIKHRRQEIFFARDLDRATEKNTFEAYQEVVLAHPG
ncbi:hypothetical protein K8R14_01085 [bacterium]|nr:hypothetical protein [bacterium]